MHPPTIAPAASHTCMEPRASTNPLEPQALHLEDLSLHELERDLFFKGYFTTDRPLKKETFSLFLIRQGKNKTLRDHVVCLIQAVAEIEELDAKLMLQEAIQGV